MQLLQRGIWQDGQDGSSAKLIHPQSQLQHCHCLGTPLCRPGLLLLPAKLPNSD